MKAYVLINIRMGEISEVVKQLRKVEGVIEANMTFGPYDAVATVQANDPTHLGHIIYANIQPIPGLIETLTCIAVDL